MRLFVQRDTRILFKKETSILIVSIRLELYEYMNIQKTAW